MNWMPGFAKPSPFAWKMGFDVVRVTGSHHRLQHPDGRKTTVPVHGKETLGPGILLKILRDIDLTREDLRDLL